MSGRGSPVVIAGGGVAGVEALLGLRHLLGPSVEIELVAPDPEFVLRPLLVGEPFGLGSAPRLDLEEIVLEQGARFRRDAVAAVDPAERSVRTRGEDTLRYDALVLAIGAMPTESVPGAINFGRKDDTAAFSELLDELGRVGRGRVVFTAPPVAKWTLVVYELALLTAAHLAARGADAVDLIVVTHEREPLGLFGTGAPAIVRQMLDEAGVELRTETTASHVDRGKLHFAGPHSPLAADHVVALPGLEVPELAGIPQRSGGFIPTDVRMNVEGLTRVWAVGDATWFPIKQGGLAAQQADVAAAGIASQAGVPAPDVAYRPVLRAALLTGTLPRYFRAETWDDSSGEASTGSLWWPPGKVAGRHLGPYLARRSWSDDSSTALLDLDSVASESSEELEGEHIGALRFALEAADADARAGDLEGALEWLGAAEEISLVLPAPWPERRREWARALSESDTHRASAEEARL